MPARTASKSRSAKAVDRQLERYRSMRDFDLSAEPRGGASQGKTHGVTAKDQPFVVQKHAARQLHYDFRLCWQGVLKSWAVAKGPSYFTGDKRLAVEVEDHPMEYGGFEGTIPKGQYGGGTVMVWDYGIWTPVEDAQRGFAEGNLKFELTGTKLKGKWALIRMKHNPARDRSNKNNWLLIKERDEYAQPEGAPPITEAAPDSAITGRTIEEIAENQDHVWDSRKGLRSPEAPNQSPVPAKPAKAPLRRPKKRSARLQKLLESAPDETFPAFVTPQLAQQATAPPAGREWIHELKLDGYRIQMHIRTRGSGASRRRVATLYTRKGLDWTARMRELASAAEQLDVNDAIIDGEVVVLDKAGRASFAELQAAFQEGKKAHLIYFAFDLLHLDGHNLRGLPLLDRKLLLADLLGRSESSLRYSEHIEAPGEAVFAQACRLGAEGIVSKVASAAYSPGRVNMWLKIKCTQEQELVIGGFTLPAKGGMGIGALLLGYYEDGKLRYAGRSGTGFTAQTHRMLRARLDALQQKTSPFAEVPREATRDAHWVKPQLVAQIAFANWTADNLVRQAAFKALREDKPAREVVRERAASPESLNSGQTGRKQKPSASSKLAQSHAAKPSKLPITHPGKILDPESGVTKQDLAEYYIAIAEHMLPHIADRPLSIVRCPGGIAKPCFFQKHVGMGGLPPGVNSVSVPNRKTGKTEEFLTLNTAEGLLGLAQLGVLEIHPWGSKNNSLDTPDRIVFDLDPDGRISWKTLASAARELRERLHHLKLISFLKSTGGKGLHVVVSIAPEHEWLVIKQFAYGVVAEMERDNPSLYITKMTKAERTNRIYLDYLRNDRESTAIAPFSPRARTGVPVAVTLAWQELEDSDRPPFFLSGFTQWKARLRRDPWQAMTGSKQRLTEKMIKGVSEKPARRSSGRGR